jgi:hypothetical protein
MRSGMDAVVPASDTTYVTLRLRHASGGDARVDHAPTGKGR